MSCYLLIAVIGLRSVGLGSLDGGLLAGAIALAFLASARQHVTAQDYGRLAARYQELASVDGMTGVCNRRHFTEAAQAALARAQRVPTFPACGHGRRTCAIARCSARAASAEHGATTGAACRVRRAVRRAGSGRGGHA